MFKLVVFVVSIENSTNRVKISKDPKSRPPHQKKEEERKKKILRIYVGKDTKADKRHSHHKCIVVCKSFNENVLNIQTIVLEPTCQIWTWLTIQCSCRQDYLNSESHGATIFPNLLISLFWTIVRYCTNADTHNMKTTGVCLNILSNFLTNLAVLIQSCRLCSPKELAHVKKPKREN